VDKAFEADSLAQNFQGVLNQNGSFYEQQLSSVE
jgi:hypothetical protein